MPRFNLEEIRLALPVERVLAIHGGTVRRGRARCPLPGLCAGKRGESLAVYRDGKTWRCHRCNSAGSVFDLIAAVDGLSLGDAIHRAAELAGTAPARNGWTPAAVPLNPERERREAISEIWRAIARLRDRCRSLAAHPDLPDRVREDAARGAVKCSRALDSILDHDEAAIARLLEEFRP